MANKKKIKFQFKENVNFVPDFKIRGIQAKNNNCKSNAKKKKDLVH